MKYNWNRNLIENAVKESDSLTDVLQLLNIPRLGNNSKTLRSKIEEFGIDISHFTYGASKRKGIENYIPVSNYLYNGSTISSYKLKEKLVKEGFKENKCEVCGISEWQGKALTIQLHHIDGNHNNNELSNLKMLCPNCHSQTESYCGSVNIAKKYCCKDCGKEISRGATYCQECNSKHNRKVERPTKEILISEFKELKSLSAIGRKYGVSDNSIKKWFIAYEMPSSAKELKELLL